MSKRANVELSRSSSVEESLNSARSVYLVLIGVCAAIALFAASPREIDKYFKARNELDAIRALDLNDLITYENALVSVQTSKLAWLKPDKLFPGGRVIASLSASDLFSITSDMSVGSRDNDEGTIDEWIKFLDVKHPVEVYLPKEDDVGFREFLSELFEFAKNHEGPELQTLQFKNPQDIGPPTPLPAYAVCGQAGSQMSPVFTKVIPATKTVISNDALQPWLASAESAHRLRDTSSASGRWVENLRSVRNEISGMKLPEAARYFAGRIVTINRKINVFGATIDEPLAIVGGPIAVLLPLVYLLLLTWHINNLPSNALVPAQSYPWIILFAGWQGDAVRASSILLPVAVCLWLLRTSFASASPSALAISIIVIILIFITGTVAWFQFSKLRRRLSGS